MTVSGRVILLVAVSDGDVAVNDGGPTWHTPTGGTNALSSSINVVRSAVNIMKLWFADGTNWKYYDPGDDTVHTWAATSGTLPVDSSGNKPRLICTWHGRTVLSGLIKDPQDWFMSYRGDPTNFNYAPVSPTVDQSVAGNLAFQGLIPDMVTALMPFNDDVLVFGGDHTLWMMRGDPMAGGEIDLISDAIGAAWGIPWCKDPYGSLYFVSNRMGIYSLVPGQSPIRISQQLENLLANIDTGATLFRMIWDDRFQGLHVFCTPYAAAARAMHLFWDQRSGAWYTDVFDNNNHNPLCCLTYDGDHPNDRVALIGSWDGYVRQLEPAATDDDGTAIQSAVVIGPFVTPQMDEVLLNSLQALLVQYSGDVDFAVYVGTTAEIALSRPSVASGTWSAGRNLNTYVRRSGHAVWVKIMSSNQWAMEHIRAYLRTTGKVRQRGY